LRDSPPIAGVQPPARAVFDGEHNQFMKKPKPDFIKWFAYTRTEDIPLVGAAEIFGPNVRKHSLNFGSYERSHH